MFSGLKVIELASVLAGPSVGQFFAELGAEVIKIENAKNGGDVTRGWKVEGEDTGTRSSYFCSVNWGKKSVNLDLKLQQDLEGLYDLVKRADIVIASYKPGDAEKLGVSYQDISKINPEIIYGKITGYGDGVHRVGYDAIIQAECGFMSINGEVNSDPLKMPVALMDILAAHQLKEALLLAYIHRLKTGKGSEVKVSLEDAAIASLANQATNYLIAGKIPQRKGSAHPNIAPYGEIFTSADNVPFVLAVGSDRQFEHLCTILNTDLHTKSEFHTNAARVSNRKALTGVLGGIFSKWNFEEIQRPLISKHIPFGRIRNIKEVAESSAGKRMTLGTGDIKSFRINAFEMSFYAPIVPTLPPELPEF